MYVEKFVNKLIEIIHFFYKLQKVDVFSVQCSLLSNFRKKIINIDNVCSSEEGTEVNADEVDGGLQGTQEANLDQTDEHLQVTEEANADEIDDSLQGTQEANLDETDGHLPVTEDANFDQTDGHLPVTEDANILQENEIVVLHGNGEINL